MCPTCRPLPKAELGILREGLGMPLPWRGCHAGAGPGRGGGAAGREGCPLPGECERPQRALFVLIMS